MKKRWRRGRGAGGTSDLGLAGCQRQNLIGEGRGAQQRNGRIYLDQQSDIEEIIGTAARAVSAEQFHARLWPNNATRLSGMEWLWRAKRA
jgi:hypothetical protein